MARSKVSIFDLDPARLIFDEAIEKTIPGDQGGKYKTVRISYLYPEGQGRLVIDSGIKLEMSLIHNAGSTYRVVDKLRIDSNTPETAEWCSQYADKYMRIWAKALTRGDNKLVVHSAAGRRMIDPATNKPVLEEFFTYSTGIWKGKDWTGPTTIFIEVDSGQYPTKFYKPDETGQLKLVEDPVTLRGKSFEARILFSPYDLFMGAKNKIRQAVREVYICSELRDAGGFGEPSLALGDLGLNPAQIGQIGASIEQARESFNNMAIRDPDERISIDTSNMVSTTLPPYTPSPAQAPEVTPTQTTGIPPRDQTVTSTQNSTVLPPPSPAEVAQSQPLIPPNIGVTYSTNPMTFPGQ